MSHPGLHHTVSVKPEERKSKIGQRSGTPQGRRHATTLGDILIPQNRKGSTLMRKGWGRVHCKFEDFEGGGSWRFGLEKSRVTWNLGLYIVFGLVIKMEGRLLWTPYLMQGTQPVH